MRYFTDAEFACKHCNQNRMDQAFLAMVDELRHRCGFPLTITSGYRHWTHPAEARKGHTTGEHTRGTCCDIACTSGADRYQIVRLALQLGFPRIGIAKNFIHLGIGGAGLSSPTIWDYQ